MYQLIKDAPLANHANTKYPIKEMAVGESFTIPLRKVRSVRVIASRHGRNSGKKFTVRIISGKEAQVWRTA